MECSKMKNPGNSEYGECIMDVGKRIQYRREELGLSQAQLAKKMGYSNRSAISRAETAGDDIGANRVKKFAEALECSPSYLMGWKNDVDYTVQIDGTDMDILIECFRKSDKTVQEIVKKLVCYEEK